MNARLRIVISVISSDGAKLTALQKQLAGLGTSGASGLSGVSDRLKAIGDAGIAAGKNLQWTGRQLQYNFTLPLALAAGAATKFALDNEKATTRLRKVYVGLADDQGKAEREMKQLSKTMEMLSDIFGVQQSQVLDIAADWAEAGASGAQLARATKLTLETMILGNEDAGTATKSLITIMQQYGLTTKQLKSALADLNVANASTAISFGDLITVVQRGGGFARVAGVDLRHLSAMAAALVPAAGSAASAGNGLKTILSRLLAPTQDAADIMALYGINVTSAAYQSLNGAQRLELMAEKSKGLTASQRALNDSIVAGRFQISRFSTLLADIANPAGNYHKVLDETANKTQVLAKYQKELGIYLGSQPQAFQILWTNLQNGLAKAIAPLLPNLLALLGYITKLVQWFTNLSPEVQQLAISMLVLLAAVGPVVKYMGAFQTLFSELTKLLGFVGGKIAVITNLFGGLAAVLGSGMTKGVSLVGSMLQSIALHAMYAWEAIVAGWQAMWAAIQTAAAAGQAAVEAIIAALPEFFFRVKLVIQEAYLALWEAMRAITAAGQAAVEAVVALLGPFFVGLWAEIQAGFILLWEALPGIAAGGLAALDAVLATFGISWFVLESAILIAWEAMWVALDAIAAVGTAAIEATIAAVAAAGPALLVGLAIAAAVAALVVLAVVFRKQITEIWNKVNDAIQSFMGNTVDGVVDGIVAVVQAIATGLGQLPRIVVAVMQAVIRVLTTAMKKVIDLLSYLNPFQRHSPSLVENVEAGVAKIASTYASLGDVGSVFRRAVDDLKAFGDATASVQGLQNIDVGKQRADVAEVAPAVLPQFDATVADITNLQGALDRVGQEYLAQSRIVDAYKASLDAVDAEYDTASKALQNLQNMRQTDSDSVFANTQQINALKLAMLQMEDANPAITSVSDNLSKLQGEIESLQANATDLRNAGAGSDVLDPINAQIDALRAQQGAIQGSADAYADMQKQIDALTRQNDIADLQKGLTLDPQIRQQQQIVDAINLRKDAAQAAYDAEKQKLDDLGDAYDGIEKQIEDMKSALNDLSQAASQVKSDQPSLNEQMFDAAGDFPIPGGDLSAETGNLDDLNKKLQKQLDKTIKDLGKKFGKLNPFKPLEDQWNKVTDWFGDAWGNFGGFMERTFQPILDTQKHMWGDLWGSVESAWGNFTSSASATWEGIKTAFDEGVKWVWHTILEPTLGFIVDLWNTVWGGVSQFVTDRWEDIKTAVNNAITFVRDNIIQPVLDTISGIWNTVWGGISSFVGDTWETIKTAVNNAIMFVRDNIIQPVLDTISGIWNTVWGNISKFASDRWDDIKSVVSDGIEGVRGLLAGAGGIFETAWNGIKKAFWTPISWVVDNVINTFIGAVNGVADALGMGKLVNKVALNVPTFHSGGIIGDPNATRTSGGTGADEQLALLQRGEGVIPRGVMAKLGTAGFENIRTGKFLPGNDADSDLHANQRGGFFGDAIDTLGNIADAASSFIIDHVRQFIADTARPVVNGALGAMDATVGKWAAPGRFVSGVGHSMGDKVLDWIAGVDDDASKAQKKIAAMPRNKLLAAKEAGGQTYPAIVDFLRSTGVPFTVTSTTRPGDASTSYHSLGRAVDFGGLGIDSPGLDSVFNAFRPVADVLAELIYAGPGAAGMGVKNGNWVNALGTYGAETMSEHHNHVHAALRAGGIVRARSGGINATIGEGGRDELVAPLPPGFNLNSLGKGDRTVIINGDLSFPNIKSGDDAEAFLDNLENLATP